MTYSDAYNVRTTSVKFNDVADAIDGLITRQSTTTSGTDVSYLAGPVPAWQEYTQSAILIITPHITNAASATIAVSGLAAKALKIGGAAIGAGVIQAGIPTILAYNGVHFEVLLQNVTIPTGQVTAFAGTAAPGGWLICDGGEYPIASYSTLSGVIGTIYNKGTETLGYFRVPDLSRRVAIGAGASDTLGNTEGGNKVGTAYASRTTSHSHTIAHSHSVPNHQHTVPAHYHTNTINSLSVDIAHSHSASSVTGTVGGSDGTHDHDLRQESGGGGTGDGSAANILSLVGSTASAFRNSNNHYTGGGHGHGHSLSAAGQALGSTTAYVSGTVGTGVNGNVAFSTNTSEGGATLTTTTSEFSGSTTPPFLFINYIIKT